MSKLHKSMHKTSSLELGESNDFSATGNSSDEFYSILTNKLNNLNIQGANISNLGINSSNDSRSGSLRSPLSRQESRQNSMLSFIIDPEIEGENSSGLSNEIGENISNSSESRDGSSMKNKFKVKVYTIPDLINVLNMSSRELTRNRIGQNEIEILLSHLYRMIISINNEVYMGNIGGNDEDFLNLFNIKNLINSDNSFLWEVWIRCLTSYGCIEVDEVASEVVESVFPILLKTINEIDNDDEKDYKKIDLSIWSFMSLILFIFYDSENHGILEHAKLFLHFLQSEKLNNDKVIESCIYMIGISLSLAYESGRFIKDFIQFELLETLKLLLLNNKRKGCKKSVAVLVGFCFELLELDKITDSENDINSDNNEVDDFLIEEFDTIASEIEILANEGSKKSGKKGKVAKNVFRQVLNTLNKSSNKDDEDDELDAIPISKSKNIDIKTWFTYIRVQILRFVLGNELSSWLAKSKDISGMLKRRSIESKNNSSFSNENYSDNEEDMGESALSSLSFGGKSKKEVEKERTKQLHRERRLKEDSNL
ncbi:hypothetical protein C6P42_005489 [Pichia californica]|nr:hypothetical protein C6P42_005489 [[Candida] californica]